MKLFVILPGHENKAVIVLDKIRVIVLSTENIQQILVKGKIYIQVT
jgi:hypothetical protein